ncbi:hypothetical protein [uncultured Formosa sp.]
MRAVFIFFDEEKGKVRIRLQTVLGEK